MARNFNSGATDRIAFSAGTRYTDLTTQTMAAWVYRTAGGGGDQGRILDKDSGNTLGGWQWRYSNTIGAYVFQYSGWNTTVGAWGETTGTTTTNAWIHLALSYDAGSTANDPIFYVNGTAVATTESTTPSGTHVTDAATLRIGNRGGAFDRNFGGRIAEAAIWSRILTAGEIKAVRYRGVLGAASGLVFYDPILGGAEADLSGNVEVGTVTGAAVVGGPPIGPQFGMSSPGRMGAATGAGGTSPRIVHLINGDSIGGLINGGLIAA